ncbi:MAG: phosphate acyltransferase PlsX [Elusimicrobia bacterium]|nr:phosphate acyltransferase PlsX [Elusimicrobiota bacterium]
MRIALDVAAGDTGLAPNIEGAIAAANAWGLGFLLVGPASEVRSELTARGIPHSDQRFAIVDAPRVIPMDADPAAACRDTPDASILACARLVAEGRAAAMVSAGHSGAAVTAALGHLKLLPGVPRPALAVAVPTPRGHTVLLDVGANTECRPWHLLQFAAMGALYSRHVLRQAAPTVGLLSVGEEESRGNDLVRQTAPLLRAGGLDFRGPVQGHDITAGAVDVVVCDGFTGNIALKLIEGVAASVLNSLKTEIRRNRIYKAGGLLLRGPLNRLKKRLNPDEYGGAPLLGVGGAVVVAHGRSNSKAIANSLRAAAQLAERGVDAQIRKSVASLQLSLETAKLQTLETSPAR